jgi:hypothetical protein
MARPDDHCFHTAEQTSIPDRTLTALRLSGPSDPSSPVGAGELGIEFRVEGWYEVLLRVDWDPTSTAGTRFSHTKIPGQEPLHSEAINALVLSQISQGRQLLRGNSLFGPERTSSLVLEVWQDSGSALDVIYAELVVRVLQPAS